MMTGISRRDGSASAFSLVRTSHPETSGIITSRMMRSGRRSLTAAERGGAVARLDHVVAVVAEGHADEQSDVRLVVDDEDRGHGTVCS